MFTATARCPAAISFIFKAFLPDGTFGRISDYLSFGSVGVGCTTDKMVSTRVSRSKKNLILFNGRKIRIPTVVTALKEITRTFLAVSIKSELPLGCGFGISGAAALTSLFASNKLLNLKIPKRRLAEIAHYAEIKEKTGLGTVATQINGGFLLKTRPGIPPLFKRLNFKGRKIFACVFDRIPTPKILADKDKIRVINREADRAMMKLMETEKLTLESVFDISWQFTLASGLATEKIIKLTRKIKRAGGCATEAILGETVLSTIKVKNENYPVFELTVTNETVAIQP